MKYHIFLDDSGQLHPNYPQGDYFVYGGLLMPDSEFHGINQSYKKLVKKIKKEKNIVDELKTSGMNNSTKKRLLNKLKNFNCHQIFVVVKTSDLIRIDFNKKRDVVRYKNYMVRRLIDHLISQNKIPKNCDVIEVNIDQQNVSHSAPHSLKQYLTDYFNEDNLYFVHKQYDTTSFSSDFHIHYRDSDSHYLIQAADLLANTMFNSFEKDQNLRRLFKSDYIMLQLP